MSCCCDDPFAGGGGSGAPVATIQTVNVVGPTAIADTMYTHVRCFPTTAGAAMSVTLPVPAVGKRVTVFDAEAGALANNITVNPNGGETINGIAVIGSNNGALEFISDGTDWDSI